MTTEIICVIDRSGSMDKIKDDAIEGFNDFLNEQKKLPFTAYLTLILFDHEYKLIHNNIPLQNIPPLNHKTYQPRGSTALLDAIGTTINSVGLRLKNTLLEKRPNKIIVVILTDGQENTSQEFNLSKIKEMIQLQTNTYSWKFVFLGANQNAFTDATNMGIKTAFNYKPNSAGIRGAYSIASRAVSKHREGN